MKKEYIKHDEEYKNNYHALCCIDILVNNTFDLVKHYKSMKKRDKEVFNDWPICNFVTFKILIKKYNL